MKTYLIALWCALINSVCAEDAVPLGLWIVETKPFPNSIQVEVKELQFFGYVTTEPNLRFASLAAVNKKKVQVYCQMVEGRRSARDYVRTEFDVKVQPSAEQTKALWELLRTNVGKQFLLRSGDTNVWRGSIVSRQSPKDPDPPYIYIEGLGLHQSWMSATERKIDIKLRYRNEDQSNAVVAALQRLVKNPTEQPANGKTSQAPQAPD